MGGPRRFSISEDPVRSEAARDASARNFVLFCFHGRPDWVLNDEEAGELQVSPCLLLGWLFKLIAHGSICLA